MGPFLVFGIFVVIMSVGIECNIIPKENEHINPCVSASCGPYSRCKESNNSAVCACLPGYIGSPPDCQRGCTFSSECPENLGCFDGQCKDPCKMDVCGLNTTCIVVNHSPNCQCIPGHTGDPFIKCSKLKKECGWNEILNEENGAESCQCLPSYLRTIHGSCAQCETKFGCSPNQVCEELRCVDPCPGTCGPNDDCYVFNHKASCRPKGSNSECSSNNDCPADKACDGYKCVDPCHDLCYSGTAVCQVENHQPNCTCKPGHYGSPYRFCLPDGAVE